MQALNKDAPRVTYALDLSLRADLGIDTEDCKH